jgi:hypothetical protein
MKLHEADHISFEMPGAEQANEFINILQNAGTTNPVLQHKPVCCPVLETT